MNTLVSTHSLTKKYRDFFSVKDVNLTVYEGDIFGFLGPNGAGKSTTLKMLLGLVKPTAGDITIFGKQLNKQPQFILKQTGSLIDSPSYYKHLTGYENLQIIQRIRSLPPQNIDKVLAIVGLQKHKDKRVAQYSLGMKQRLGIAMALISFPKLLILDEPTNGLDPAGIGEIRELIKSLPQQFGITVIISSHLLSEIEQIASSVGIINNGEILFQGELNQLQEKGQAYITINTFNNKQAVKLILQHGYPVDIKNNSLILKSVKDNDIAFINKQLVINGIDVSRIELHKKNLEEIFLDLTRKE